jgi:hypothetical protein
VIARTESGKPPELSKTEVAGNENISGRLNTASHEDANDRRSPKRPSSAGPLSGDAKSLALARRALRQPQPQPVAGRVGQVLFDPEVALGGADGGMAQAELDLRGRQLVRKVRVSVRV